MLLVLSEDDSDLYDPDAIKGTFHLILTNDETFKRLVFRSPLLAELSTRTRVYVCVRAHRSCKSS